MAYSNSYGAVLLILSSWLGTRWATMGEEISSFVGTSNYCITNGSSALAYITSIDDPRSLVTPKSHVFPTPTNNLAISCEMEEHDTCNHLWTAGKWSLENSLYGKIRQAITDWRWEELSVIQTHPPNRRDKTHKTYLITEFNHGEEFQIAFSVLTKQDAHIFLCNGTKIAESTCYWGMLGSWNGGKSALRLCNAGEISDTIGVWPLDPCYTSLIEGRHKSKTFLGEDQWSHITLKKSSNMLTLSYNTVDFLTHPFREKVSFVPRYILIQTRMKALWKLHKYAYIYCEKETSEKLGPSIPMKAGQNCISMFIVTCATCQLFFKFVADQKLIYHRGFNTPDEKWMKIKLLIYSNSDLYTNMYVTTVAEETRGRTTPKIFWAIDSVRQCSAVEHRFLSLKRDLLEETQLYDCELVKDEKKMEITLGRGVDEEDSNCPEDTIGASCIPCQLLGRETCTNVKYCESVGNAGEKCYCSSGYYTRDCGLECPSGTYGHGCKKTCESCPGRLCNNVYGYCNAQCLNSKQGPRCDIPPKEDFLYPLSILAAEEMRLQVQVPSSNLRGSDIWLQYKEVGSLNWNSIKQTIYYDDSTHLIDNLTPDTEYNVRAQIVHYNDYKGDDVDKNTFRTICRIVEPWQITITSMKTSVIVTFQQNRGACNPYNYEYGLNGVQEGNITTYPLRIVNLEPCKTYDLYIKHLYSGEVRHISFTTDISASSGVKNVTYINRSPTEILMTWNPPSNEGCLVSHYVVKYRRRGATYCPNRYSDEFQQSTAKSPKITLRDLIPYSRYEVNITEVTDIGLENEVPTTFQTLPSDTIEEGERPYVTTWKVSPFNIILSLREIDCNEKRGQIYLEFEVKCQTDWCSEEKPKKFPFLSTNSGINLSGLQPYVNYTVKLKVSRSQSNWNYSQLLNETVIATRPSYPTSVSDVLVVSSDDNFISLRWVPPYPPTGILDMYKIQYRKTKNKEDTIAQFKPLQCRLWPNHHCATIREDITKGSYTIEILATNKEPKEFVSVTPKSINAQAWVDIPDPPTDVSARFLDNNTLMASWVHPEVTNGVVESFLIEAAPPRQKGKRVKLDISNGEDGYKLVYSVLINEPEIPWCTEFKLQLMTKNRKYKSSSASTEEYISPPPIPTVAKPSLEVKTSNTSLTVEIPRLDQEENPKWTTKVYLLVSVSPNDYDVYKELANFENSLRNDTIPITTYNSRLVLQMDESHLPPQFQIGDALKNKTNPPLEQGRRYSVHLIYVNRCYDIVRLLRLSDNVTTVDSKSGTRGELETENGNNAAIYTLFLLVLLVPLAVFVYLRRNKASPLNTMHYFKRHTRDSGSDTIPMTDKPPEIGIVKPIVNPQRRTVENLRSVPNTTHSKPIKISDYESYVREAIANGELERQHALFPRGQTKPWEYGACAANKSKNRYNNLIAYDHTRVKLRKIAGVEYSDYINANFIDGYKSPRAYIATQGPKAATLNDFWRMIWQHKVENIVMLANLSEGRKKKVEKYWPDINEDQQFQGVRVQYVSSQVFADYEYRVFNLSNNGEQRKVEQLHFTSWPDHGVPLYSQSLVPFLQKILKIPNSSTHPVVVHCSAGVGRTGTIILCDICLRMAAAEGSIDCLANLEHLRSQRPNMVDNVEQYKLVHLVVLELLFGMQTHIACDDKMEQKVDTLIASGGISQYMRYLEDTEWKDRAMDTVWNVDDTAPVYPEKNRFQDILPDPQHRVFLARYPNHDEKSSYINAVRVDGFRSPGRFIVTQQPMPNTLGDFWRLVNERKSSVIISLNDIDTNNKKSCQFWPINGTEMKPVDFLTVQHVETKEYDSYDLISLHLISHTEDEPPLITIVSLKNWKPGDLLPNSMESFFSFWEEVDVVSRKSDPVIITCYDGATASGLYVAMSFVIDKMKLEHVCDVCLAVRNIRHNRRQFVTSEEQFEFLYRMSVMYINDFQPYANFS